jgi:hypothetical protein
MESDLACEIAPAAADARAFASHRHRSAIQPHTRQRIKRVVHSSNAQHNAAQHGRARTSIRIASCLEPASCSILPLRARACCITGRRRISSTVGRSFGCGVQKQQRDDEDTTTTATTPQRRRRHHNDGDDTTRTATTPQHGGHNTLESQRSSELSREMQRGDDTTRVCGHDCSKRVYESNTTHVWVQHVGHHVSQLRRVPLVDGRVLATENLQHERAHVASVERVVQRRQLVQHAAERPHVTLRVSVTRQTTTSTAAPLTASTRPQRDAPPCSCTARSRTARATCSTACR